MIGGDPAPLLGADGLIRVFFRSPDNNLFVITQKQTSGYFDDPVLLTSGCASDPSVAMNMDGCFTVIYRGSNNAVWQVSHNARSYTTWGKPSTLGGSVTGRPVVARDGAGKLTVLAIGGDTGIWTVNQTAINNTTTWSQWMSLGGATASELFAAKWADQRVAVFYTGGDGAVYTYAQQPNYVFQGVPSANHTRLGATVVGRPSAALAADGRLAVFATSKQQPQLLVADQTTVNGSAFSAFAGLGGNLSGDGTPVETGPWLLTVGVLDCFYRGINNNELWYQAQTTA